MSRRTLTPLHPAAALGGFAVLQLLLAALPITPDGGLTSRALGVAALFAATAIALVALRCTAVAVRTWSGVRLVGAIAVAGGLAALLVERAPLAGDLALLVTAGVAGAALARLFDGLPVAAGACVLVSIVDLVSVYAPSGATGQIVGSGGTMAQLLSVAMARPGQALDHSGTIGFADLAFMACLALLAQRFALSRRRTTVGLMVGSSVPIVISLAAPMLIVAALPAIAGGWLVAHRREVAASLRFRAALTASLTQPAAPRGA